MRHGARKPGVFREKGEYAGASAFGGDKRREIATPCCAPFLARALCYGPAAWRFIDRQWGGTNENSVCNSVGGCHRLRNWCCCITRLHAQAKPPVYYVAEIDVSNPEAYAKEYAPKAQANIKAAGGRFLAIGGSAAAGPKVTALDGEAPKRAVVQVWDSMEKIEAWQNSAEEKKPGRLVTNSSSAASLSKDCLNSLSALVTWGPSRLDGPAARATADRFRRTGGVLGRVAVNTVRADAARPS